MKLGLNNKICLVTGAGRGIGKAIALALASEGAVVYANTRTEEAFRQIEAEFEASRENGEAKDGCLLPAVFDINNSEGVMKTLKSIRSEKGCLDILVNNAAVVYNERIGMISPVHVSEMLQTNVSSMILLTQQAVRLMGASKSGSIVNITSAAAVSGDPFQTAYTASKGAVISFTKSAALELARSGIRVNAVAPGLTRTDMLSEGREDIINERIKAIPLGKIAEPADIANAVVFLCSEAASHITGEVLSVSGGAH